MGMLCAMELRYGVMRGDSGLKKDKVLFSFDLQNFSYACLKSMLLYAL